MKEADSRWVRYGACKVCRKGTVWLSPHDPTPTLCCDNCPAIYPAGDED